MIACPEILPLHFSLHLANEKPVRGLLRAPTMLEIADKLIDGIKLLRETAKKMQNAELQGQIADLLLSTADLKVEMAELKADVLKVRDENAELKRMIDLRANIEFAHDAYWMRRSDGTLDGPFSTVLWDKNHQLVRMQFIQKGCFMERGDCHSYCCSQTNVSVLVPNAFIEQHGVLRSPKPYATSESSGS